MILLGLLLATGRKRILVDDQEATTNVIQYIIIINISYLADEGVQEYLHKILDKYRKKTSDVFIDKYERKSLQLGLDVGGLPLVKI